MWVLVVFGRIDVRGVDCVVVTMAEGQEYRLSQLLLSEQRWTFLHATTASRGADARRMDAASRSQVLGIGVPRG
jgi:hypothetical protein